MRCAAAVILALSFLPAIRSAQAAPRRLLAVLEFRNQLPANQRKAAGDRLLYSERLRRDLAAQLMGAHVMTREEMQALVQGNPAAFDRCNDEDCIEVGRLLGADVVIDGTFTSGAAGRLALSLRAVETRGGKVIASVRVVRATGDELLQAVDGAAESLAARLAPLIRRLAAR